MRRLNYKCSNIHRILSVANQIAIVTAEVAKVEEIVTHGGGSVHQERGEIFKPNVTVEEDDEGWDLEGIMTDEEVEASEVRGKNTCTATEMSLRKRRGSY